MRVREKCSIHLLTTQMPTAAGTPADQSKSIEPLPGLPMGKRSQALPRHSSREIDWELVAVN